MCSFHSLYDLDFHYFCVFYAKRNDVCLTNWHRGEASSLCSAKSRGKELKAIGDISAKMPCVVFNT